MKSLLLALVAASLPVGSAALTPAATEAVDVVDFATDKDSRMTVLVRIGGAGPYRFVVDTGAERTVLSEELALTLGLSPTGTAELHSVTGIGRVNTVSVESLSVNSTAARDLTAPLLKQRNLGADGLLGIDSLQSQRILLDFRTQTMTVVPSKRRVSTTRDDPDTIVVSARNRLGRLILVDATAEGRKVAVIIDTGAEHSIGNAALRKRVIGGKRDAFVVPTRIFSVTGGSIPAEVTIVKSMTIGGLTLNDMPIAFADMQIFEQLGLHRRPAMLLGMNTLRAFDRVSVDFANRKVSFVIPGDSRRDDGVETALLTD